jgi:hypothetical protein
MPHLSRRGVKRFEMGHRPHGVEAFSSYHIWTFILPVGQHQGGYKYTYVRMDGRNERPYVMRREGFGPLGADAQKGMLQVFRRKHSASIKDFVRWSVGLLVCRSIGPSICRSVSLLVGLLVRPHITLNVIFSAVCGQIDLKFGRDLHVDLSFQFLLLYDLWWWTELTQACIGKNRWPYSSVTIYI